MASYQYSYVMKDLSKTFPGGKEILKGVTLSFLPDAKIGVLGVNGAGKSTLMKMMAGKEEPSGGEAWAAEGVRVGYLEQEPELDPDLDRTGENVTARARRRQGSCSTASTRFPTSSPNPWTTTR